MLKLFKESPSLKKHDSLLEKISETLVFKGHHPDQLQTKLDGLGHVDNRPSTNKFYHFI